MYEFEGGLWKTTAIKQFSNLEKEKKNSNVIYTVCNINDRYCDFISTELFEINFGVEENFRNLIAILFENNLCGIHRISVCTIFASKKNQDSIFLTYLASGCILRS